jgi:cell division protein FtsN
MSRDYKPNRHSSRDREPASGGGAFKGILYGLILGLAIAAAVAWWFNRMPSPFIDKTGTANNGAQTSAKPAPSGAPPAAADASTTPAPTAALTNSQGETGQPIVLPGKPGDPVPETRFQFPDILSGKTDGTTAAKATKPTDADKTADSAKSTESPAGFYLMAGSFQKPSDADAQKANLALIGFDASVQKTVIGEKVWYRVKIGPFKRQDDANRARNELKDNGIDAVPARN